MIRIILISILLFCLSGCSLWRKFRGDVKVIHHSDQELAKVSEEAEKYYSEGVSLLAENKNQQAIEKLLDYDKKFPTSRFAQAAEYTLARAFENLEMWSRAIESFRKIASNASSTLEQKARSLYRLSFCYEALGQNEKAIASLLDLRARASALPREMAEAEVPARLAAAYARQGLLDSAFKYYVIAEKALQDLKRSMQPGKEPEWLAKTLFYMGTLATANIKSENFEDYLRPLKRAQMYLLQSAELMNEHWSKKSRDRIEYIYGVFWSVIEGLAIDKLDDPILAGKSWQKKRWQMVRQLISTIDDFKMLRLPKESRDNIYVKEVFTFLAELKVKGEKILAERPVEEGLTPAQMRKNSGFSSGDPNL